MSTSSKASWIANSKRISLESDALEKKTNIGLKSDELKHEAIDLNKLRNESKVETIKRVHGIRLILSDIQNKIKNNSWQSSNALKNQLETFENEQAISLENDLTQLGTDMESWDNIINDIDISSLPDAETQKRIHERNKVDLERRAFIGGIDRKIAALGRDGGWDPRDQDTFLRVWLMVFDNTETFEEQLAQMSLSGSQHNDEEGGDDDSTLTPRHTELIVGPPPGKADGTPSAPDHDELSIPRSKRTLIIKKLATAIPWKSGEEFDQHIDWYLTYLRLTLTKKKVVSEWKQEQLSAKRQQQDAILVGDILQPGDVASGGGHFLNTSGSQDGSAAGDRSAVGTGMISAKERAAAKARIANWKEAQAQQQRQEKERKAQEEAAETRRLEEERRKKKLQMREQLGRWKEAEQVNKELVGAASAKLQQRPRSVDPAAMRRRQARDLETAKARNERMEAVAQKKNQREKTIMEAAVPVTGLPAERDPQRLRSATKASEGNRLTYEALDQAQYRRGSVGAHGANIALSGRDLQYAGRATPQWMKTARSGY